MAKNSLPSVDAKSSQPIGVAAADSVQQPDGSHLVEVQSEGYIPRNVDVRMARSQAAEFRDILRDLEDEGAKLNNGNPVNNRRRAVLYMIENWRRKTDR